MSERTGREFQDDRVHKESTRWRRDDDFGEPRVGSCCFSIHHFVFVAHYRDEMIGYYVGCHVGP